MMEVTEKSDSTWTNTPSDGIAVAGRLGAVFSTGRSGSTWLGAMIDTLPNVAYRFEPFHRKHSRALKGLRDEITQGVFTDVDLSRLYDALLPASAMTDKAPFFKKSGSSTPFRPSMWWLARAFKPLRPVYKRFYTPRNSPVVVFKEVSMERIMASLLARTTMPIVYLMRSPFATVASLLEGQERGIMPTGRQAVLAELLADHSPKLLDEFGDRIAAMGMVERNALLWRFDVETALDAIKGSGRGHVVFYENLCRDAASEMRQVCDALGLDVTLELERWINRLYDDGAKAQSVRDTRNPYFSVFRDPRDQIDKWKKKLSRDEVNQIRGVVEPSPAFCRGVREAQW